MFRLGRCHLTYEQVPALPTSDQRQMMKRQNLEPQMRLPAVGVRLKAWAACLPASYPILRSYKLCCGKIKPRVSCAPRAYGASRLIRTNLSFAKTRAKSTIRELTKGRCTPEFFPAYTVTKLREWCDYDLENGRSIDPSNAVRRSHR